MGDIHAKPPLHRSAEPHSQHLQQHHHHIAHRTLWRGQTPPQAGPGRR
jgi:hypothetical protein